MDSEASSIGSKSRATTFSVVSSSSSRAWNEKETQMAAKAIKALIDAMAYRGFTHGRMVSIERMNSYVKEKFGVGSDSVVYVEYQVDKTQDAWRPIYDLVDSVDEWIESDLVRLALSTFDYVPVVEIDARSVPRQYTEELLAHRHDSRMEGALIEAMSPDWGSKEWYTTPAYIYSQEHGHLACQALVLRTPCARYARQTVGKNELYNLHGLAQSFGYSSVSYLSFEPLTSYSKRVIDQRQIATQVTFFPIESSQYNILRHVMVPYYRLLTEEGARALEERHSKEREYFPRVSKADPVVKWMQFPANSVLLEVPHMGFGYDASRFCYVLSVKEGEEEECEEEEE